MFCKFENIIDRGAAVKYFKDNGFNNGGSTIWAKPDLPLVQRVPQSLLFGAKYLLCNKWGLPKARAWADLEDYSLWVDGEMAIKAAVVDGALKVDYGTGWEDYLNGAEWNEIVSTRSKTIEQAAEMKGKGKGKMKE